MTARPVQMDPRELGDAACVAGWVGAVDVHSLPETVDVSFDVSDVSVTFKVVARL